MPQKLVTQINANIIVDVIEPDLPFWQAVGFDVTVTVPEDGPEGKGPMGFAILSNGDQQLMYQTIKSVEGDMDIFGGKDLTASPAVLFLITPDIDAVDTALDGHPKAFDKRQTFYGSTEISYFTASGTNVTFAEFGDEGN